MLFKIIKALFKERYGQRYVSSPRIGILGALSYRPRLGFGLLFEPDVYVSAPEHPQVPSSLTISLSIELFWVWLLIDITVTKDKVDDMPKEEPAGARSKS